MQLVLRLISALMAIVLFVVMALAGWMQDHVFDAFGNGDSTAASAVVAEHGFQLNLDGVTISAATGVAPPGTPVRAQLIERYAPKEFADFSEPVGKALEIAMGDNVQPTSPVTIVFEPDSASNWVTEADYGRDALMVVIASREDGSGAELAEAQVMPDGSVVVTTDHLSLFTRARASIDSFASWLGDEVSIALQARSREPACVGQTEAAKDWTFSAVPRDYLWTCADESSDGVTATFTNNSSVVWLVESDEATPGYPIVASSTAMFISVLALQLIDARTTAPIAPPDGTVTFAVNESQDQIVFNASLNGALTLTGGLWNVIASVLPPGKVERVAEVLGTSDCFISIAKVAIEGPERAVGELVATITSCLGAVIEGATGALISSVTTVPALAVASGTITHAALAGETHFTITMSKEVEPTAEPENAAGTSSWPTKRNDNPNGLYTWLGANFFGLPDWSACDDAGAWCLVGYEGESHVVIRMKGFDVIGKIPDSAKEPEQELLELGVPADSVNEILGP